MKIRYFFLIYIFPIIFIITVGVISEFLLVFGINDYILYLAFFPIMEEAFKFFSAKEIPELSFKIIISFGIFELILSKVPQIYGADYSEVYILALAAAIALNFHIATAFFHNNEFIKSHSHISFPSIIFIHSLYNGLGIFTTSMSLIIILSILVSAIPFIIVLCIKKFKFT